MLKTVAVLNIFEFWIFCNIINVFTATFDTFYAYLLNKGIKFFKKNIWLNVLFITKS